MSRTVLATHDTASSPSWHYSLEQVHWDRPDGVTWEIHVYSHSWPGSWKRDAVCAGRAYYKGTAFLLFHEKIRASYQKGHYNS